MKTNKHFNIFFILAVMVALAFTACFSSWEGEEGVLTISFGGENSGRSVQWPPYSPDENEYSFKYPMSFLVILDGPTGIKEEHFNFDEGDSCTDIKFSFSLASGLWSIYVENIINNNFLYASGSNTVYVNAGQTNSVGLSLKKKYYEIGDTGPGGGIIFYVDPEGFTLLDTDERKNKTCHYLEAAPSDTFFINKGEEDHNPKIGSSYDFFVANTNDSVGEGRRNTQFIVRALGEEEKNMAAQLCTDAKYGGFNDWFLPSIDELNFMYRNLYPSLGDFLNYGMYWSSSFFVDPTGINVRCQIFDSEGNQTGWGPTATINRVRAVRAF